MDSAVNRKGLVPDVASSTRLYKSTTSPQWLTSPQMRPLAIRQHKQDHTDHAIQLYQAFLKLQPNDTAIWCNLGAAPREQKHYQSAINCYGRVLEIQPNDLTASGSLANALKDLHRLEAVIVINQHVATQKRQSHTDADELCFFAGRKPQFAEGVRTLNYVKTTEKSSVGCEYVCFDAFISIF